MVMELGVQPRSTLSFFELEQSKVQAALGSTVPPLLTLPVGNFQLRCDAGSHWSPLLCPMSVLDPFSDIVSESPMIL